MSEASPWGGGQEARNKSIAIRQLLLHCPTTVLPCT